jgi:hypothetical protein
MEVFKREGCCTEREKYLWWSFFFFFFFLKGIFGGVEGVSRDRIYLGGTFERFRPAAP